MKRIVFVANRGYALTSSRTSIIERFLTSGWEVVIATANDSESKLLNDLGAHIEPVVFNRGGFSITSDISSFHRLCLIYRRWKPNLIHHFHAKPVILGTLAAHLTLGKSVQIFNTITGLGHAFITGGLSAKLAGLGYKFSLPHSSTTIFQNNDDRTLFLQKRWVSQDKAKLITSSGVDTDRFFWIDRKGRKPIAPVIVFLGRLIRQKGIGEFIEVARRILPLYPESKFLIAGEEDTNHPDSVPAEWVNEQKNVQFLGRLPDVVPLLTRADLLLFPSYREGVPRVVLEAAATGLPTIGFDVPGVREVIVDRQTGYLVPDKDIETMTDRVAQLLDDEATRLHMGRQARKMVEETFESSRIEEMYFQVYRNAGFKDQ